MDKKFIKILGVALLLLSAGGKTLSAYTSVYISCSAEAPDGQMYNVGCLVLPNFGTGGGTVIQEMENYASCEDVFAKQNPTWNNFQYISETAAVANHPNPSSYRRIPLKANPGYDAWPANSPCINIDGTSNSPGQEEEDVSQDSSLKSRSKPPVVSR